MLGGKKEEKEEERLSGSEDVRTNYTSTEDLNPHCDLDLEHSNPKLKHNTLACDDASCTTIPSLVAKGSELQEVIF